MLVIFCLVFLLLPFSTKQNITFVDQLFNAISIVSTTGLCIGDFARDYTLFGQGAALFFIQLGGLGYMALSTFLIIHSFEKLPRISARLLRLEFHLPQRYPLLAFLYGVICFTFLIEFMGSVLLYYQFSKLGIENALWHAIFISVSAFCTAGFSSFQSSLEQFSNSPTILSTVGGLSFLGSIGFIVLMDFWLKVIRKRKRISLTSKTILTSTLIIWLLSSTFIWISDALDNTSYTFSNILFNALSAHTTVGFNSVPILDFGVPSYLFFIVIMVIGASPAGTGGGIKTTSFTVFYGVINSVIRRRKYITLFGKSIPPKSIYIAITSLAFYISILLVSCWLILIIENNDKSFISVLFECASALSTVGLSLGITSDLESLSKLILAFLMFIGRIGVLTFGFALIKKAPLMRIKPEQEDLVI